MTSIRFWTFTFWNSYVLKLLRLETLTYSDVTLSDINVVWCYVLSQYRFAFSIPFFIFSFSISLHVFPSFSLLLFTILSPNYPLLLMCPFYFPPILPFCLMPLILLTFYFLYPSSHLLCLSPYSVSSFIFVNTSVLFFQGIFIINSAPVLLSPMYIVLIRDRAYICMSGNILSRL